MPVPMIAPIPRSVSSKGESTFFRPCTPPVHSISLAIGLVSKMAEYLRKKACRSIWFTGESLFIRFKGDVIIPSPGVMDCDRTASDIGFSPVTRPRTGLRAHPMTDKTKLSFEELAAVAGTAGISSDRAGALRQQYGANVMTPPAREPLWKQYLEKFDDPIIRILLLAVGI